MTNVMLVEDHASFRQAIAFFLDRESGCRVVAQAGTLAEARRLLTKDVDLAVVDLMLPDGSGTEFIQDLRQLNPEATALVLTATIDPEDPGRAMEAGATEVLSKSVGVGEIVGTVRRLVAGR